MLQQDNFLVVDPTTYFLKAQTALKMSRLEKELILADDQSRALRNKC